jgi:hypothetical protein
MQKTAQLQRYVTVLRILTNFSESGSGFPQRPDLDQNKLLWENFFAEICCKKFAH